MQILEDTVGRIFKIMDPHWDSQSWEDLTGFEYAEADYDKTTDDYQIIWYGMKGFSKNNFFIL